MLRNLSKQFSKRPWKTPSPSNSNEMKSPRYLHREITRKDSFKQIKQDQSDGKSKPMLHSFKNQLVELKQQANKVSINDLTVQSQGTGQLRRPEQKITGNEIESYNSYFNQFPSSQSSISNKQTHSKKSSDTQIPSLMKNKNTRYEQSAKKYIEQYTKLKTQYAQLSQKYQSLASHSKKIQLEIQAYRTEIQNYKNEFEEKRVMEIMLSEEVIKLKDLLQINKNQLKNANFDIYKMKQEIFQLSFERDKKQKQIANATKKIQAIQKIKINKTYQKSENKLYCQTCKSSQKLIISLNSAMQNKMFQIGKKDIIISTLCSDLKKLQQQLKVFQKPKGVLKKINFNAEQINQLLMKNKAIQLSNKLKQNWDKKYQFQQQ